MMLSGRKLLKKYAIVALLPFALYGCGSSLPEATDDQLIEFFSHDGISGFGPASRDQDAPKLISNSMVDCLAALSGASFKGFEAPPKELADFMRADCQSGLLRLVNNKEVNVIGFKMKDFESKELTERVYKLREKNKAAYDQYIIVKRKKEEEQREIERQEQQRQLEAREQERQRQEEARKQREIENGKKARQKVLDELNQKREQYAAIVASLDDHFAQLRRTCDEFKTLNEEVRKVNQNRGIMLGWTWDDKCKIDTAKIKIEANELLAKWNELEPQGSGTSWYYIELYISSRLNGVDITNAIKVLDKGILEMKTILGR
ncbi:hypothetical protein N5853_02115 [Bartonella sp. HY329]|uniref:hypothetical protein n=1 Tax=unclassified Bartonella TaxID=2645622 RepID=UPI0021C65EB5|nr:MULTISPECIES: hypothetical protein [unclassified Bartonella]UXM95456.1 hypothetical protein N5853_02115 [Bartonella sp. HY329]UXN09782.1 hypothetical protein N5852_02125 [Bartonella sp. HY328]